MLDPAIALVLLGVEEDELVDYLNKSTDFLSLNAHKSLTSLTF